MHKYIKGAAFKINAVKLAIIRNMSLSFPGKQGDLEGIFLNKKASVGSSIKNSIWVSVSLIQVTV